MGLLPSSGYDSPRTKRASPRGYQPSADSEALPLLKSAELPLAPVTCYAGGTGLRSQSTATMQANARAYAQLLDPPGPVQERLGWPGAADGLQAATHAKKLHFEGELSQVHTTTQKGHAGPHTPSHKATSHSHCHHHPLCA